MTAVNQYQSKNQIVSDADRVILSPAALAHVKAALTKRGHGIGLRLSVTKTGCSGYGYVVDFIDEVNECDRAFPLEDDLVVAVDGAYFSLLKGTKIDYTRKGLNEIFVYENPNQTGECGCGESFSV